MPASAPIPAKVPGRATVSVLVVATAAAGGAAVLLGFLLSASLLFDLAAGDPALCTAAAAAVLAVGFLYVRLPWSAPPEEAGPNPAITVGARALTAAAGASVISLLPGGDLVLDAAGVAGGKTLLVLYVLAVLGAFAGSVLLQFALCDASPTPATRISYVAVRALKPAAVMLMGLTVLGNLLVAFG